MRAEASVLVWRGEAWPFSIDHNLICPKIRQIWKLPPFAPVCLVTAYGPWNSRDNAAIRMIESIAEFFPDLVLSIAVCLESALLIDSQASSPIPRPIPCSRLSQNRSHPYF